MPAIRLTARPTLRTALGTVDARRESNPDQGQTAIHVNQELIKFVVGPLSSAKLLDTSYVEILRIGMAATAVLIVNRYHPLGAAVALVFVVSFLGTSYVRTGAASQVVTLINTGIIIVFDIAVASIVGHAAFGAGKITIHRIMGAVILYLYLGLIFSGFYRLVEGIDAASFSHFPGRTAGRPGRIPLFQHGIAHVRGRRTKHRAGTSHGAKPCRSGSRHRATLSCHLHRASCHASRHSRGAQSPA